MDAVPDDDSVSIRRRASVFPVLAVASVDPSRARTDRVVVGARCAALCRGGECTVRTCLRMRALASVTGSGHAAHAVHIARAEERRRPSGRNVVVNQFSAPAPRLRFLPGRLVRNARPGSPPSGCQCLLSSFGPCADPSERVGGDHRGGSGQSRFSRYFDWLDGSTG